MLKQTRDIIAVSILVFILAGVLVASCSSMPLDASPPTPAPLPDETRWYEPVQTPKSNWERTPKAPPIPSPDPDYEGEDHINGLICIVDCGGYYLVIVCTWDETELKLPPCNAKVSQAAVTVPMSYPDRKAVM